MSLTCEALDERLGNDLARGTAQDVTSTASGLPDARASDATHALNLPHLLISVELDQDQELPNSEACRRSISSFPGLAKHVKVEGVYRGYSTVLVLSIPVVIWTTMPEHPACRPITYVTSRNLLRENDILNASSTVSTASPDADLDFVAISESPHKQSLEGSATVMDLECEIFKNESGDCASTLDKAFAEGVILPGINTSNPSIYSQNAVNFPLDVQSKTSQSTITAELPLIQRDWHQSSRHSFFRHLSQFFDNRIGFLTLRLEYMIVGIVAGALLLIGLNVQIYYARSRGTLIEVSRDVVVIILCSETSIVHWQADLS